MTSLSLRATLNLMSNITPAFINKKALLIILLILVAIPFMFLYFSNQQKVIDQSSTQPTGTSVQLDKKGNQIVTNPTGEQLKGPKWTLFEGESFTFQYPPDWNAQEYGIAGGGTALIIKPKILPEGLNYPQFVLQTQPATPTALQNKRAFLEGFSMQKSETQIGSDKAIVYKGTIPFKSVGDKTVNEPLQDTTVLLEKDGTLYTFKYEYEGSERNAALDDYFNDFILSFKAKE